MPIPDPFSITFKLKQINPEMSDPRGRQMPASQPVRQHASQPVHRGRFARASMFTSNARKCTSFVYIVGAWPGGFFSVGSTCGLLFGRDCPPPPVDSCTGHPRRFGRCQKRGRRSRAGASTTSCSIIYGRSQKGVWKPLRVTPPFLAARLVLRRLSLWAQRRPLRRRG